MKTGTKPLQTLTLIAFLLLLTQVAWGQEEGSAHASRAYLAALQQYKQAVKNQELLFNGSQYIPMEGTLIGHPYFHEEVIEGGRVVYDDILFTDVTMRYDVVYDLLVVHHINQEGLSELVQLRSEKVNSFDIGGFHFEYVAKGEFEDLEAGFYIPLYRGHSILYKKVIKEPQKETNDLKLTIHFNERIRYYLVHDEVAHRIKGKGSLLKIFKEDKSELKSYIRKAGLSFGDDEEGDFIKLLKYYDEVR